MFYSSTFGGLEAMITGLCDEFPKSLGKHREMFVLALLGGIFLCCLPTCTYVSRKLFMSYKVLCLFILHYEFSLFREVKTWLQCSMNLGLQTQFYLLFLLRLLEYFGSMEYQDSVMM